VNAITPTVSPDQAIDINVSNLAMLRRLAELGMQLAELTAREALQEATAKPEQLNTESPRARGTDARLIFLRLWHGIHANIELETRLAAGIPPKAPRPRHEPAPPQTLAPTAEAPNPDEDPRRAPILHYFREGIDITQKKRKIPITHQQIEERVDAELAKDPNRCLPGNFLLLKICKSLDLPFYATRMPIDLLRPPRPLKPASTAAATAPLPENHALPAT
jgi:hypothetical protein